MAFGEAWDFNENMESMVGLAMGVDRSIWKAMGVRAEGILVHVQQRGTDGWLRGFTVGSRTRWGGSRIKPFVDVAVGLSHATARIPVRGTAANFLALAGGGVQMPVTGRLSLDASARWLHLSNNGREGRDKNPDIQALGAVIAIGWAY